MSKADKAEQRAFEAYPVLRCYNDFQMVEEDVNEPLREKYQEGYHQAEQDLELTWEDIKTIDKLLNQCVDCSNPYQEVLKRFKERKENERRKD